MAQLHFDGFDLGVLPDYATTGSATTLTTSSITAFGSGLSLSVAQGAVVTKTIPASAEVYVGFRYSAVGSAITQVLQLFGDAGVTEHVRLWWSNQTTLVAGRGSTSLATAAVSEPIGSWVYVEVRATIADAGGRLVVKIDGATVIDFTGDTKNAGTASTIDTVRLSGYGASGSTIRRFDDLYINDATGAAPHNTFYGPCRVYALSPTGAGSRTDFTPSSGTNWSCVDEQPYSAADYVSASTVGARDTYALADLPSGVTTVYGVRSTAVAIASDAAPVSLKTVTVSGGTTNTGAATALGPSESVASAIRSVDPATGAAWTVAGVNAAEAGFEVA